MTLFKYGNYMASNEDDVHEKSKEKLLKFEVFTAVEI